MKHIGIVKPDMLVNLLNWLGIPTSTIYFFSMLVFPWIYGSYDWNYVQDVWDRWQSLNVGMLALISSITAFNISRFNANKQRERNFLAAKAFLPAALSELCTYFELSAVIYVQAWGKSRNEGLEAEIPTLPNEYRQVFGECIKYAEPEVGDYLSRMLVWLQVHDSRLRDFVRNFNDRDEVNPDKFNLISYLYRLAELQALVNKIFDFARNRGEFDSTSLVWEDFRNAFRNIDVWYQTFHIDETMNLEAFTKRAIERNLRENT